MTEPAERLTAVSAGLDEAGGTQPADVPADERLGEPDLLDQVPHGCVTAGKAANDPEPVDVGKGLVDDPQLAELVGLVDDRGEGRTDAGGRRQEGVSKGTKRVASTTVYINRS